MAEQPSQLQTVIGQPPTPTDDLWLKLAGEDVLSPDKSLDRLDSYAKFVFGSVSLVGTALTGFGLFGSNASRFLNNAWFLLPVALFCLSLALTVTGIIPRTGEVKPYEINSIRSYYTRVFRWRAFSLTMAGYLFAASLATVPFALFMANSTELQAQVSMRLTGAEDTATLAASVKFTNLPSSAIARTEIQGYGARKDTPPVTLFSDISHGDSAGNLSVSASGLSKLSAYERLMMRTRVTSGRTVLYEGARSIER